VLVEDFSPLGYHRLPERCARLPYRCRVARNDLQAGFASSHAGCHHPAATADTAQRGADPDQLRDVQAYLTVKFRDRGDAGTSRQQVDWTQHGPRSGTQLMCSFMHKFGVPGGVPVLGMLCCVCPVVDVVGFSVWLCRGLACTGVVCISQMLFLLGWFPTHGRCRVMQRSTMACGLV